MKTIEQGFELRGQATPIRALVGDVWRARSLIRMLSRRDFYIRYRRPSLGVAWALVIPMVQAIVLSIVFVVFVPEVSRAVPMAYPIFVLSGVLPWTFFSMTLGVAARAITGGSAIASKVYFPRAVLPLVSAGANLYGFIPTLGVLVIAAAGYAAAGYEVALTPQLLVLIPATLVMVALTAAFSLVVASLQVYFRDVAYAVTALLQPWFYISFVFFSIDRIPERFQLMAMANPATGMVELFRIPFLGLQSYSLTAVGFTLAWTVVLVVAAILIYRRFDRVFVDLL